MRIIILQLGVLSFLTCDMLVCTHIQFISRKHTQDGNALNSQRDFISR